MTEFNSAYIPILRLHLEEYNKKARRSNVLSEIKAKYTEVKEPTIYNSVEHGVCAVRKTLIEFESETLFSKKATKFIASLVEENSLYDGDDLCEKTFKEGRYGIPTLDYLQYVYSDDHAYGFAPLGNDISTVESSVYCYFKEHKKRCSYLEMKINQTLDWLDSIEPESDYEQRLQELGQNEYIWYDDCKIIAGIFETERRWLRDKESLRDKDYVGVVGKKGFETMLKVKQERTYLNGYGRFYIVLFEDKSGNVLKWHTESIVPEVLVNGFRMCRMSIYAHISKPYKHTQIKALKVLTKNNFK